MKINVIRLAEIDDIRTVADLDSEAFVMDPKNWTLPIGVESTRDEVHYRLICELHALARERIQEYETIFWLEVGEEHKTKEQIDEDIRKRLEYAIQLSDRIGLFGICIVGPALGTRGSAVDLRAIND